jgi:serine/threonine protein kinase
MSFLHASDILHRDLKSLNTLLDDENHVKITDFGLSKQIDPLMSFASSKVGTAHWGAPEIFEGEGYRKTADVYSFGVVMWELFTNEIPWSGLTGDQILACIRDGDQLISQIPSAKIDSVPHVIYQLLQQCLSYHPENRPCFDEIVDQLKTYLQIPEKGIAKSLEL